MSKNPKVEAYIDESDNPLKEIWQEIRGIVLGSDPKMEEDIKWGAPAFVYKGNMATFNPRAKKSINLTFHSGAQIPDPDGVLEGDVQKARVFRVASSEELGAKRAGLEKVTQNWVLLKDGQAEALNG